MNSYCILYQSGGETLEISPDAACRLVEDGLHGFDCTGFDVKIQPYAASHGGYAQTRRFAERELSLTFEIAGHGEAAEQIRRKIISMTSPESDGVLDISLFGVRRMIDVIPADDQEFERAVFSDSIRVTLHFIAPHVFFRDCEAESVHLTGTSSVQVRNRGDAECGIVAKIRASGGPVVNPKVYCGEKFIRCPMTLGNGDELVIDTRTRQKNITKNGVRCFVFDRDSTFFSLPRGVNELGITCEGGGAYMSCEIAYVPAYYGI